MYNQSGNAMCFTPIFEKRRISNIDLDNRKQQVYTRKNIRDCLMVTTLLKWTLLVLNERSGEALSITRFGIK